MHRGGSLSGKSKAGQRTPSEQHLQSHVAHRDTAQMAQIRGRRPVQPNRAVRTEPVVEPVAADRPAPSRVEPFGEPALTALYKPAGQARDIAWRRRPAIPP